MSKKIDISEKTRLIIHNNQVNIIKVVNSHEFGLIISGDDLVEIYWEYINTLKLNKQTN